MTTEDGTPFPLYMLRLQRWVEFGSMVNGRSLLPWALYITSGLVSEH